MREAQHDHRTPRTRLVDWEALEFMEADSTIGRPAMWFHGSDEVKEHTFLEIGPRIRTPDEARIKRSTSEANSGLGRMKRTIHLPFGLSVTFRVGDCSKVKHGTAQAATIAAYSMEQRTGESFDVYRCRWCKSWQVGHAR